MPETQDTIIAAVMEQLIDHGPDGMAQAFAALFNLAMRIERERFLGARHYERLGPRPSARKTDSKAVVPVPREDRYANNRITAGFDLNEQFCYRRRLAGGVTGEISVTLGI